MEKAIYMVIDIDDPLELPLFVGTLSAVARYAGVSEVSIRSAISHAKARGQKCKYIKIPLEEDNEEELK